MRDNPRYSFNPSSVLSNEICDIEQVERIFKILQSDDLPHNLKIVKFIVKDANFVEIVGKP